MIPSASRTSCPGQSETLAEFLGVKVLVALSVEHALKLWNHWAEIRDEWTT